MNGLPVLLPSAARLARAALDERTAGAAPWRLRASHGAVLVMAFLLGCGLAQAQAQAGTPSILATIWKWTPLLAQGFVFNLAISFLAMTIRTLAGFFLGAAQISLLLPVRKGAFSRRISSGTHRGSCCCSTACSCCRSR